METLERKGKVLMGIEYEWIRGDWWLFCQRSGACMLDHAVNTWDINPGRSSSLYPRTFFYSTRYDWKWISDTRLCWIGETWDERLRILRARLVERKEMQGIGGAK